MKKVCTIVVIMIVMLSGSLVMVPGEVSDGKSNQDFDDVTAGIKCANNDDGTEDETEDETEEINVDDLLDELDISRLNEYFDSMSEKEKALFGSGLKEWLGKVARGEFGFEYSSFVKYLLSTLGGSVAEVLPILLSIVAVAVTISFIGGIKGGFSSKSTDTIVSFAGVTLVSVLILIEIYGAISDVRSMVTSIRDQMEIVFPVLFTLMSALGAGGSIAVYQPAVAVLAFSVTELVSSIALPALIVTIVFSVVGNLSGTVKLGGAAKFCVSAAKWILYTTFFLFLAFLSVQGITAAIYDNVSVRAAKFALSKYVPVIGGYLSEGFNVILAGSVLIKNAVGMTAVLILLMTVVPTLLKIIVVSLSLKLAGAITEPFEGGKITSLLGSVSNAVNLLIAVVCGLAFLYFIFLILLIASGNLVL